MQARNNNKVDKEKKNKRNKGGKEQGVWSCLCTSRISDHLSEKSPKTVCEADAPKNLKKDKQRGSVETPILCISCRASEPERQKH